MARSRKRNQRIGKIFEKRRFAQTKVHVLFRIGQPVAMTIEARGAGGGKLGNRARSEFHVERQMISR